ncbi:tol-pal system protein YbgF [Pelagibacterium xiamenense]|uniref:tol-pal system protein YbgF n=1 Tax=Pelagibacterium xiamenense TaxID=2901140 RepID=UPI001E2E055A|nr:tol-pal system protein YbgF [Pelagibacterium xiamenense]MCD7060448.1 tol-pal system protein YbgF [Pelagibacterium xiamenense]
MTVFGFVSGSARSWRRLAAGLGLAGVLSFGSAAPVLAQSQDIAALQVRISQLEEQVRTYSGQIEGLQFQLTQLQTLIERMQEDNEFRFQQLEGGGSGESEAVTTPGGATPSEALPPSSSTETLPEAPATEGALVGDEDLGELDPNFGDEDRLYASDVFEGEEGVVTGPPEAPLGQTPPSAPLDLSFDANQTDIEVNDGDANAQFQAGYDAIVRGETAFAEEQFRQFLELFPDNPQAPDATYWLGQTLIQRGAYHEAANVLITGFEAYPTSSRAPDLLLDLGVALHGAGEFDTACRTYSEVLRRYPEATDAFKERVVSEQARAGC